MKKDQVQIGQLYAAKITDQIVPVRIDAEHKDGGWTGTNTRTNRKVRIKTAQKLRHKITPAPASVPDNDAKPTSTSGGRVKKKLTAAERKARSSEKAKQAKVVKPKKVSLLDAAAKVLGEAKEPMTTKQMIDQVTAAGLWSPGAGKTPHATLYSAILREMQKKGSNARFTKVDRGQFALAKGA